MDINEVAQFVIRQHSQSANAFRKGKVGGVVLPYWQHCFDVYKTVWRCGVLDGITGPAALGHDLVEECPWLTRDILEFRLGKPATDVIYDLTFVPDPADPRPAKEQKSDYLTGLRNKSIDAAVIKPCDRYRNVIDFVKQGDTQYAKKYLAKGEVVWEHVEERQAEIEARWGTQAVVGLMGLRARLNQILNY